MEYNKIIRGGYRASNNDTSLKEVIKAGFICQIGFQLHGQTQIIPTAYGEKDGILYLHGHSKNQALQAILENPQICISITHTDGLVLATTLFDSSINYRSAILLGTCFLIEHYEDKLKALEIITNQIIPNRWQEVSVGTYEQIMATTVIGFKIESASVKIRQGGPEGDDNKPCSIWSGYIPLRTIAEPPIGDIKFNKGECLLSPAVAAFFNDHKYK